MWKTVHLLLAASLCGCVAAKPPAEAGGQRVDPMPVSLALEEIITAGVRQHLKDPLSARFGAMLAGERALNGRQEIVVCGHVADKGSSGDNKPFMAKVYPDAGNSFELVALGDGSPSKGQQVGDACRAAGLSMSDSKAG